MSTSRLALSFFLAGLVAGCAATSGGGNNNGSGDDGMSGDDGAGDDGPVPFTNGVSTLAGMAQAGYKDGVRRVATFANPVAVVYRDGIVYVADFDNGKIRAIDSDTHDTRTVVSQKGFVRPFGMVFADDGTLYVSTDNDANGAHNAMSGTVWRVDVNAGTATVVANAIGRPRGLVMLPDGRLAAADYQHYVIETIDVHSGKVTTVAGAWDTPGMAEGAGTVARFASPYTMVLRSDGKLLVTDYDNNRLRLVGLDGATSTLAGTATAGFADGAMNAAEFNKPQALSMADNGDIYLTDTGNFRVRKIVGDQIQTIAGDGKAGYIDNDNPLAAEVYGIEGLSVVPDGSMLYLADGSRGTDAQYNRIRQIKLP